jgi:high affinity sulfate transporter 1
MNTARARAWIPGLRALDGYRAAWVRDDLLAGLALTALLIPAGISYAQAAGLPAVTGLYATVVPLLAYAVMGPSRILVLGPDSALIPLIAAAIVPMAAGDPDRAVALAGLLSILVGVIMLVGGLARLGFVTDLLSMPIRVGYLNGLAIVLIANQFPKLLGFSVEGTTVAAQARATLEGLVDGEVVGRAALLGFGAILVMVLMRLVDGKVPAVLVAVVGSMAVVAVAGWSELVPVVGELPRGLPSPALGGLGWDDVASLVGPAAGIALIALADTSVLSRSFAARRGEVVDGSEEMRAVGVANIASGLFGGFAISGSTSRTPVAERAGARSQLTNVVGAVLVLAFVLLVPGLTRYLPTATLAAIVIIAAITLIDLPAVWRLLRVAPWEGLVSVGALVGVVAFGVISGILVAIGLALVAFVIESWRPYRAELGRIVGVRGYHDLSRHPEAERIPGVLILRFDAPLFFANSGRFGDWVRTAVREGPPDLQLVILAAEPITEIDSTAIDDLVETDEALAAQGVRLVIAEMKGPMKDQLRRYGLGDRFTPDRFAPTVGAAVDDFLGHERSDIGRPSDRWSGEDRRTGEDRRSGVDRRHVDAPPAEPGS